MKQNLEERKSLKILIKQVRNLIDVMESIDSNPNASQYKYSVCNNMVRRYQDFAEESVKYAKLSALFASYDVSKLKNVFDMTGIEQQSIFYDVLISAKMLLSTLITSDDFIEDENDNFYNDIKSKFRGLFFEIPENEKEVQDNFERLLHSQNYSKGIDYDRESGKMKFSGREYIPDFIIPKLKLCIEIKLVKKGNKSKIIEQINADITAYSKEYENILFLIYDVGGIRDEEEFKKDIENINNTRVLIIKN